MKRPIPRRAADIFKRDPLLLELTNQRAYGAEILRNVLIRRTATTDEPIKVDLHDPNLDRKLKRPRLQPIELEDGLKSDYGKSRLLRQPINEEDRKKLEKISMVARGEETALRAGKLVTHKVATAELEQPGANSLMDGRLRIAAVGFRVKISKLEETGQLEEDLSPASKLGIVTGLLDSQELLQLGRTVPLPSKGNRWSTTIAKHIQTALDSGSQIVVLPEFALPPASSTTDIVSKIREFSLSSKKMDKRGKPCDHFIFAGSRHEGGYNRALILHLKDEKLNKEYWHYKMASARGLGENILGPDNGRILNYQFRAPLDGIHVDMNIVIAICYDSFDPSMFLSLVWNSLQWNRNQRIKGQLILVPSFNPSPDFVEMLRDLSFLAQCPVLYVNSLHGDARMFISGFSVRDLLKLKGKGLVKQIGRALKKVEQKISKDKANQRRKQIKGDLRTESERIYTSTLAHSGQFLRVILKRVQVIEETRGLEHLITVEECQLCETQQHLDDYECSRDIIYYNLDWELLLALAEFRSIYHSLDDSYLPAPLREAELKIAREEAEARWKRRRGVVANLQ